MRFPLIVLGLLFSFSAAGAQSIVRDSVYDTVNQYWRARLTVALPTADTLAVTCDFDVARNAWAPEARLTTSSGWDPSAVGTTSVSFFGMGSTKTASRIFLRWPPSDIDYWEVVFARSSTNALFGAGAVDPNQKARDVEAFTEAQLKDGYGFVKRLAQHGRVAFLYPTNGWLRSGEWTLEGEALAAWRAMQERCGKAREGQPKPGR